MRFYYQAQDLASGQKVVFFGGPKLLYQPQSVTNSLTLKFTNLPPFFFVFLKSFKIKVMDPSFYNKNIYMLKMLTFDVFSDQSVITRKFLIFISLSVHLYDQFVWLINNIIFCSSVLWKVFSYLFK